jgi:hypothetical protein
MAIAANCWLSEGRREVFTPLLSAPLPTSATSWVLRVLGCTMLNGANLS